MNAFQTHAQFLQDAPRRQVPREMAPLDAMQPELGERVVRECPRGLGCKALALRAHPNPVADLCMSVS